MSAAAPVERPAAPVLRLENIRKEFGGVVAIENFTLDVHAGEVRGAGRRQRRRQIDADQDHLRRASADRRAHADRRRRRRPSPIRAPPQKRGIQVVFQDLALAEQQPVYMNLFLGRELVTGPFRRLDRRRMIRETEELVQAMDVRIPSARHQPSATSPAASGRASRSPAPPTGPASSS